MAEQFNQGYAVLIGVGEYKQKNLTVMQAAHDAEDFKNLLVNPAYCGYPPHQVIALTNEQATQTAIITALQKVADDIIDKQATVIVMFSGHGYNQDGSYYFLPHDTEFIYGNYKITGIKTQSAISNEVLVNQIRTISQRANKTLVIFHSCHSGGMGTAFGFDSDDEMMAQLQPISFEVFDTTYQNLAQGKGTAILASSQQNQLSWAFGPRNSLFMERVIAVLQGAGIADTEKYIELLDFIKQVKKSVREIAQQKGKDQDPDYRVYGGMAGDFLIALRLGGKAMGIIEPTPTKLVISPAAKRITGIPTPIYNEMRRVLLDCAVFTTFKELRDIFVDSRISLWKNGLPTADSYEGLIQSVMAYLHQKTNIHDENGLVLFLEVLLDKVDPNDICHKKLKAVAQSFELAVSGGDGGSFGVTASIKPNSVPSPAKINIGVLHQLLTKAFNPASLDRFLNYSQTPAFQEIRNDFGFGMGLNDMVDQVIDYCQRHVLLEQLLTEVKAENPAQYALYESQLY